MVAGLLECLAEYRESQLSRVWCNQLCYTSSSFAFISTQKCTFLLQKLLNFYGISRVIANGLLYEKAELSFE